MEPTSATVSPTKRPTIYPANKPTSTDAPTPNNAIDLIEKIIIITGPASNKFNNNRIRIIKLNGDLNPSLLNIDLISI